MERERGSGPAPPPSAATWMLSFQGSSDARATIDASYLWASGSRRCLLGVGFRSSQQAARAAWAGLAASHQFGPVRGADLVAAFVRQQQRAAAPTASNRGCLHENAVARDRSAVSLLHPAERAPAAVGSALFQLVRTSSEPAAVLSLRSYWRSGSRP